MKTLSDFSKPRLVKESKQLVSIDEFNYNTELQKFKKDFVRKCNSNHKGKIFDGYFAIVKNNNLTNRVLEGKIKYLELSLIVDNNGRTIPVIKSEVKEVSKGDVKVGEVIYISVYESDYIN